MSNGVANDNNSLRCTSFKWMMGTRQTPANIQNSLSHFVRSKLIWCVGSQINAKIVHMHLSHICRMCHCHWTIYSNIPYGCCYLLNQLKWMIRSASMYAKNYKRFHSWNSWCVYVTCIIVILMSLFLVVVVIVVDANKYIRMACINLRIVCVWFRTNTRKSHAKQRTNTHCQCIRFQFSIQNNKYL